MSAGLLGLYRRQGGGGPLAIAGMSFLGCRWLRSEQPIDDPEQALVA